MNRRNALRIMSGEVAVGGPLFHTVDDRERMVRKLDTEFVQAHNEAMVQMGWTATNPMVVEQDPRWEWFKAMAFPLKNEWTRFRDEMLDSWTNRFVTNWDIIQSWQNRLNDYRQLLASKFSIASPNPSPLTQTMWQQAGEEMKNIGSGVASTLKTLAYIAVGGGVIAGIVYVYRSKSKEVPSE